jgi:HEAT repeat protein
MRDDPVPQVRIVAAEAVAGCGTPEEAVGLLAALVNQPPSWQVQLQALNALTFVGAGAKSALPAAQRAAESEQEYVRSAGRYLSAVLTGAYTPSMPIFDIERMMRQMRVGGAT